MSKKRSAKGQFVKSGAAKRATRATPVAAPKRKRRRRNPDAAPAATAAGSILAPVTNPPDMRELADFILPGFAGYGATKMLSRIVATQLAKKYPNAGKHVAAGSTIVAFLAAWFLLHRIKRLAHYQMPATVGAGIAVLQTIVSTYLPKYGWMVSDVQPDQLATKSSGGSLLTSSSNVETLFPGGPEVVDDDDESLEDIDLGSLGHSTSDPLEYATAN